MPHHNAMASAKCQPRMAQWSEHSKTSHDCRPDIMPGLLQTPDDMFGSARFASAVAAELLVRLSCQCIPWSADLAGFLTGSHK